MYCLVSSRSITLPSVERSNAITAESRVASIPGWVWIATSAANCTGIRSNSLHSSTKIETAICCIRRNKYPGLGYTASIVTGLGLLGIRLSLRCGIRECLERLRGHLGLKQARKGPDLDPEPPRIRKLRHQAE